MKVNKEGDLMSTGIEIYPSDGICRVFKTCKVCNKEKTLIHFLRLNSNGKVRERNTCKDCNESNSIEMQLDNHYTDVEVSMIGKQWISSMSLEKAKKYIQERAAIVTKPNRIKILYTDKELKDIVLEQDNYSCFFCGDQGTSVYRLVPKLLGGIKSPVNLVCTCDMCSKKPILENFKMIENNPLRLTGEHCKLIDRPVKRKYTKKEIKEYPSKILYSQHAEERCKLRQIDKSRLTRTLLSIKLSNGKHRYSIPNTPLIVVYEDRIITGNRKVVTVIVDTRIRNQVEIKKGELFLDSK